MSLIQQALKRKMDEQQGKTTPHPPPLPAAPLAETPASKSRLHLASRAPQQEEQSGGANLPPLPALPPVLASQIGEEPQPANAATPMRPHPMEARQAAIAEKSPVRMGRIAVAFVVLLIVALIAIISLMFAREEIFAALGLHSKSASSQAETTSPKKSDSQRPPASTTAATPAPANPTAAPGTLQTPLSGIHARVDKMKDAVKESNKSLDEASQGMASTAPATAPAPATTAPQTAVLVPRPAPQQPVAAPSTKPVAAPVVQQPPLAPPVQPAVNVVWPEVRISGVMAQSTKNRTAIINDALCGVGDSIDGMVVVEIRDGGVLLEYKGDRRSFGVGRRR